MTALATIPWTRVYWLTHFCQESYITGLHCRG